MKSHWAALKESVYGLKTSEQRLGCHYSYESNTVNSKIGPGIQYNVAVTAVITDIIPKRCGKSRNLLCRRELRL
jgi:hypothetical protein